MMKIVFLNLLFALLFFDLDVKFTLHNLSNSGPGKIKSEKSKDICGFCHTPHNANPEVPLWGYEISEASYNLYFSPSLDSILEQPGGSSKLCLSCHDGSIALMSTRQNKRSLSKNISGYNGLDLTGSHPVSFVIDDSIISQNNKKDMLLKNLKEIKVSFDEKAIKEDNKMECTTCHDPHKNIFPQGDIPFGRIEKFNLLCTSCHIPQVLKHEDRFYLPKECETCHKAHGENSTMLLKEKQPDLCYFCHGTTFEKEKAYQEGYISSNSNPKEIISSFSLPYRHTLSFGCTSCHKIHKVNKKEYEICQECHKNNPIYSYPASMHPVFPSENNLKCSSCHRGNEESQGKGVHGSIYKGIIYKNYETEDGKEESEETYSFCYSCHKREDVLEKSKFALHKKHISEERTSCYTCHSSHGSIFLPSLLTFEDKIREDRISPTSDGILKYEKLGDGSGACYLTCHDFEHNGLSYGENSLLKNSKKIIKTKIGTKKLNNKLKQLK
jgi:predicted CXXCH cytochrome family protein